MTTKMREYVSRFQQLPSDNDKVCALFFLIGGLAAELDAAVGPHVQRNAILAVLDKTLGFAGENRASGKPATGNQEGALPSTSGLE